jgi:asparagine synthase (glutamine-hydrolysing)
VRTGERRPDRVSMSRIGGIVTSREAPAATRAAEVVVGALRGRPDWETTPVEAGRLAGGWTGSREPGVGRSGTVTVLLDGTIFDRGALNRDEPIAAALAMSISRRGAVETARSLNGDFAFAGYDSATDELWLVRDRFGVKPLYYARADGLVAFASRPRPLLHVPGVTPDVDRRYVAIVGASHYRYIDNLPDRSPFADVDQVPMAHAIRFRDGERASFRYWSLDDVEESDAPAAELAARYRELLLDAVGVRLAATTRPAFTLSGGMDSTSVLGSAVQVLHQKQHAFSSVYADDTYDESAEIKPVLDEVAEQWHPVPITDPAVFDLIDLMVAAHDEPVATATWLSHFVLSDHVARGGFGALFGGLGGDELNAGEYEYFPYHFADLRVAGRDAELAGEVAAWSQHHDHPVFRKDAAAAEAAVAAIIDPSVRGRFAADRGRIERYADALEREFFDLRTYEPEHEFPFKSYLRNRTYQDLTRETTPCCLRAEDRHAAAFGIEHFDPFLDYRVAELMFSVPGSFKIRDGITKRLLREATLGIVPDVTRERIVKTGWNAPAHLWFVGKGRVELLDRVRSARFRDRDVYNIAEVERLIGEHASLVESSHPVNNHMMFLWQVANVDTWLTQLEREFGSVRIR